MRDDEVDQGRRRARSRHGVHRHAPLPALTTARTHRSSAAGDARRLERSIRRWLALPEIEDWWGPRTATEADVVIAMDSPHAICRDHRGCRSPVSRSDTVTPSTPPSGANNCRRIWRRAPGISTCSSPAASIAASVPARRRWRLLRDEVFSTTLAVAVAVFPALVNERAVRAYEKAGFRWKRVWNDPARRSGLVHDLRSGLSCALALLRRVLASLAPVQQPADDDHQCRTGDLDQAGRGRASTATACARARSWPAGTSAPARSARPRSSRAAPRRPRPGSG